jgi:hypothetical protein
VFTGVFVAEEVDAVRDKGSGDKTMVDMQRLLVAFLNVINVIVSLSLTRC